MLKLFRKIKKDNRGSAIVVVIIALAFVGILSATAMWMSMANYRMKATDKGIKGNFYSAETVFEQIVAGLQGVSSDAAADAYRKVMQNYVTSTGEEERYSRFVKFYKDALIQELKSSTDPGKYKKDMIYGFLDDELQKKLDPSNPAYVTTDGNSLTMSEVLEKSADTLDFITLKDFELKFTDSNGYYSVIKTDIMISAPDMSFTMSAAMPDVFKYAIIADEELVNNTAGNANINGNVYVGEKGMALNGGTMTIDNADYVISMGDVKLTTTNSKLNIKHTDAAVNTQFWARDIDISTPARRQKGGILDIDADIFVEDDLTLQSPGSKVTLKGKYSGYGNSTTDASGSSAIMINNLNNDIDMSGLSELTVAGGSFVDLSSYYKDTDVRRLYDEIVSGTTISVNDIPMGESIAVKSDQVAFLVPEECVWITAEKSRTSFTQNPVVWSDSGYIELLDRYCDGHDDEAIAKVTDGMSGQPGKKLYQVMLDQELKNGKTLSAYVNSTSDIVRVFSTKGSGSTEKLLYYYMKMSPENARKFIQEYYGDNTEKMKEYFAVYIEGGDKLALPEKLNISGTYLAGSINGVAVSDNKIKGSTVNTADEKKKMDDSVQTYRSIIKSLTEKLVEGGYENTTFDTAARESHVFQNIIDESKVNTFLGAASGVTKKFTLDDGYYAMLTNVDDYVYPSGSDNDKCRLIIAMGNVEVKNDFTGVLFAKGKVTISGGDCTVTNIERDVTNEARSQLVRVLQCRYGHEGPSKENVIPLEMFTDGSKYVLAGTQITPREDAGTVSEKVDVLDTVNYKNWIKK